MEKNIFISRFQSLWFYSIKSYKTNMVQVITKNLVSLDGAVSTERMKTKIQFHRNHIQAGPAHF